jgi:hypothetical protein
MHQTTVSCYLNYIRQAAFDYLVAIMQQGIDAGIIKGNARKPRCTWLGQQRWPMTLHAAGQYGHSIDEP